VKTIKRIKLLISIRKTAPEGTGGDLAPEGLGMTKVRSGSWGNKGHADSKRKWKKGKSRGGKPVKRKGKLEEIKSLILN